MTRHYFYLSKAWKRNSKAYAISKNCICEHCGRPVYVEGVTDYIPKEKRINYVVHHKIHINDNNVTDNSIAFDWDNLELLCLTCHHLEHRGEGSKRSNYEFDENGNLVQTQTIDRYKH